MNNPLKDKIREKFIDYKIYLSRATGYIALANTGMIMILFLDKLQQYGWQINIKEYIIITYIATIILCGIIGWIDVKIGFFRDETSRAQKQNPEIHTIIQKLDELNKKIECVGTTQPPEKENKKK